MKATSIYTKNNTNEEKPLTNKTQGMLQTTLTACRILSKFLKSNQNLK